MTLIGMVMAIVAPWAAGSGLMARACPRARWPLKIGAGWMFGQVLVVTALYAELRLTGSSKAPLVLVGLSLFGIAAAWRLRRLPQSVSRRFHVAGDSPRRWTIPYESGSDGATSFLPPQTQRTARRFTVIVAALIGISLLCKFGLLAAAHGMVPSRCDDAISIWLFKAKVIATLDHLPLDPADPYYLGGSFPHYPVFVPLLAAWTPLVSGGWNEYTATLPWLFFYLNLVLLIAGGLADRLPGFGGWIAAYLVGTTPLLVIHAYRPGYADLICGCFLASAVLFWLRWRASALRADFILGLVLLTAAACCKREGVGLAVIVLVTPGMASVRRLVKRERMIVGISVLAATALVCLTLDLRDQSQAMTQIAWQPGAWAALARHLFEWFSFGPLWWAVVSAIPLLAVAGRAGDRLTSLALTISLVGFVCGIFLLTPQSRFALNDQTPSRLLLQIMPAVVIALAWALPARDPLSSPQPRTSE